jgi:hypothetical protein
MHCVEVVAPGAKSYPIAKQTASKLGTQRIRLGCDECPRSNFIGAKCCFCDANRPRRDDSENMARAPSSSEKALLMAPASYSQAPHMLGLFSTPWRVRMQSMITCLGMFTGWHVGIHAWWYGYTVTSCHASASPIQHGMTQDGTNYNQRIYQLRPHTIMQPVSVLVKLADICV